MHMSDFWLFIGHEIKGLSLVYPSDRDNINRCGCRCHGGTTSDGDPKDNDRRGSAPVVTAAASKESHNEKLVTETKPLDNKTSSVPCCDVSSPLETVPRGMLNHMARLPFHFEKLMTFSTFLCVDAVLFEITFMPIQAASTFAHIFVDGSVKFFKCLVERDKHMGAVSDFDGGKNAAECKDKDLVKVSRLGVPGETKPCAFSVSEFCGAIRTCVLLFCILIFSKIDTSRVYHSIRGQPLLKLYVLFNMLETCERLCRSFGRDITDALMATTIEVYMAYFSKGGVAGSCYFHGGDPAAHSCLGGFTTPNSARTFKATPEPLKATSRSKSDVNVSVSNAQQSTNTKIHKPKDYCFDMLLGFFLMGIYVLFHALLHLVRVLSLNIAINSSDAAMFLLLVTNNFAEIKSTVFKKFTSFSIFTIVCSDAMERIHLFCDALLIFLKMYAATGHKNSYFTVLTWLLKVLCLEIAVDYFKHSFLLKFNNIPGDVFNVFSKVLLADVLLARCRKSIEAIYPFKFKIPCKYYSFSHVSSRRVGFMPTPMVTLILCTLPKIAKRLTLYKFACALVIWCSLVVLKVTMSILLLGSSISRSKQLRDLDPSFEVIGAL